MRVELRTSRIALADQLLVDISTLVCLTIFPARSNCSEEFPWGTNRACLGLHSRQGQCGKGQAGVIGKIPKHIAVKVGRGRVRR